tara:strand:+ start:2989 stop:4458 length:1470 start_codon:yes stop_codon:yes gene_type:complete
MSDGIHRFLPNDEYQAAVGANGPDSTNVYATIADLGGAASTLYNASSDVPDGRIATLLGELTWTGGKKIRTVNGRIIKEVTEEADLPAALVANTTYVIRGKISVSTNHTCNVEGAEIIGLNRDSDEIEFTGVGTFLTLTDCNFNLNTVKFSSTQSNAILAATNIGLVTDYNAGRSKVLTILNCQFRGTFDIMDITGYDLVDINNCLFFYIKATNFGLRFEDTSKIEITSCELIRWFDETTIPISPSGWSTASMIELQARNIASFGAININSCIIHPQQTQIGIDIDPASATLFGTISSNAFVPGPFTGAGKVFSPINAALLPDYSTGATYAYDVFANQGILNSTSGIMYTVTGNTQDTALSATTPTIIDLDVAAVDQASVRFNLDTATGKVTYQGTKQIYVSCHISITFLKLDAKTDDYTFYIAKGDAINPIATIAASALTIPDLDDIGGSITLIYGTLVSNGDFFETWVESTTGDDILVNDIKFLIRE